MTSATLSSLQRSYASLCDLAGARNPLTLPELRASNGELRSAVDTFKDQISSALCTLPKGQRILVEEYEALCQLAKVNDVDEKLVFTAVVRTEGFRVDYLDAGFLSLKNLSPLSGLTGLQTLTLSCNGITEISPLAGLKALKSLWITGNKISDISPLAGLKELRELYAAENQIRDIGPLAGLTELTRLHIQNNQIRETAALCKLSRLKELEIALNPLTAKAAVLLRSLRDKGALPKEGEFSP